MLEIPPGHDKWKIESTYLMCYDSFEREFWRGRCECGFTGKWKFWRSYAYDDKYVHQVDVALDSKTAV